MHVHIDQQQNAGPHANTHADPGHHKYASPNGARLQRIAEPTRAARIKRVCKNYVTH